MSVKPTVFHLFCKHKWLEIREYADQPGKTKVCTRCKEVWEEGQAEPHLPSYSVE